MVNLRRPNWGDLRKLFETNLNIKFDDVPCFNNVNRVRLLNNCFKHSNGTINEDFAKNSGGTEGDDIEYESEDWEKLISGCKTFLLQLANKIKNRRA